MRSTGVRPTKNRPTKNKRWGFSGTRCPARSLGLTPHANFAFLISSRRGKVFEMKVRLVFAVWIGMAASVACVAETPTQQSLEARLKRPPFLMIRGCYAGSDLAFDAQGNLAGAAETVPFSLCAMRVDKIQLTDSALQIQGVREGLEFTPRDSYGLPEKVKAVPYDKHEKFEATIARSPAVPDQLDTALARVFSIGIDDALAASAPDYWQPWLHFDLHPKDPPNELLPLFPGTNRLAGMVLRSPAVPEKDQSHVKPPQLLHTSSPSLSNPARHLHYQGVDSISLIVDASGLPQHVFITHPLGMGLDEKSVELVQQQRFKPATYKGKPVPVQIWMEVTYRIY